MSYDDFLELVYERLSAQIDRSAAARLMQNAESAGFFNDQYDDESLRTEEEAKRMAAEALAQDKRDQEFLSGARGLLGGLGDLDFSFTVSDTTFSITTLVSAGHAKDGLGLLDGIPGLSSDQARSIAKWLAEATQGPVHVQHGSHLGLEDIKCSPKDMETSQVKS